MTDEVMGVGRTDLVWYPAGENLLNKQNYRGYLLIPIKMVILLEIHGISCPCGLNQSYHVERKSLNMSVPPKVSQNGCVQRFQRASAKIA